MDLVKVAEWLSQNGSSILFAGLALLTVFAILSSSVWRRAAKGIENAFFTNWRLALLGSTGIVLSVASGWTTWDGMRNFTGEPLLSFMVTFGIQGVMLIVAWLIGESFAAGMNQRGEVSGLSVNKAVSGAFLAVVLAGLLGYLAWQGTLLRADHLIFIAIGVALIGLIGTLQSDLLRPYLQSLRVITKNAVLWLMFFACMATSVFFSFDSLFSTIFPASERQRAAELRAQNQVAGILADIGATMTTRQLAEAEALFRSPGWQAYESELSRLATAAQGSQGEIERYFVQQMEDRRRSIAEQQERIATAKSGQAGLAGKKTALSEELTRLTAERPALAAEYTQHKNELDLKAKEVDAKRVEAMAEERGVEGSGKVGRGQFYRERMAELGKLQDEYKIKEERTRSAEKRLAAAQLRIEQIRRELATIDGDLAALMGEAQTAEQRIRVSEQITPQEDGAKIDPSRVLPIFERARADFRQEPTAAKLVGLQQQCANLLNAMSSTPTTKPKVGGIDCDPKQANEAAATLFTLNDGMGVFAQSCAGGDKLVQHKTADQLFGFARKCLADSGLPSKDTDALRTQINYQELNRDDKAHRFVVTWNAFGDGNRLAYLALAIAVAIDGLVFLSGLFGANAIRSPLSDVPNVKARSARQLEDIIETALIPHRFESARMVLGTMRPMTPREGFMARVHIDDHDPHAMEIRRVLNAGATIGAVRHVDGHDTLYEIRSELFEYLSSVTRKEFESDKSHAGLAEMERTVQVSLLPDVGANAEMILSFMHPMREDRGFMAEMKLEEVSASDAETNRRDLRTVRNALNAGATFDRVQRVGANNGHFYIHGDFYKTLVRLRARLMTSAAYPTAIAGPSMHAPRDITPKPAAIAGPDMTETRQIAPPPAQQGHPGQQHGHQAEPPMVAREPEAAAANDREEETEPHDLYLFYWSELVRALGIQPDLAVKRLAAQGTREQALGAWRMLDSLAQYNHRLDRLLKEHRTEQEDKLAQAYSYLRSAANSHQPAVDVLDAADGDVNDIFTGLMLFPENGLLDFLIDRIERAAEPDDGLADGEQELLDTLRHVRRQLAHADLADAEIWQWVSDALRQLSPTTGEADYPNVARFPGDKRGGQS